MHRRVLSLLVASTLGCAWAAQSQDSQSLGDAARQARLQKQQKDARAKDAPANSQETQPPKPPKKVVTNDDIPQHVGSTLTSSHIPRTMVPPYMPPNYDSRQTPAEQLKAGIEAPKNFMASMQRAIDRLNDSLQNPETCVTDCAQRNKAQLEKQQQLELMKAQMVQLQKHLEDMQEMVRKQGFGSAVYDP
jgi:chemotaxis protein histidine kinase CheA